MYCTNCGNEIKDNNNYCTNCGNNINVNISNKLNLFTKRKIIVLIILIFIICTVIILNIKFDNFSNVNSSIDTKIDNKSSIDINKNRIGNSIGNIRNYGYATMQSDWIYYIAPNISNSQIGIFKIDKEGNQKQELFMGDENLMSLNVSENYIFFIGAKKYNTDDSLDNKIYKMKLDGTELEIINNNEFHDNCYEIYVVDEYVYYIGIDSNIYKMNLNGSNRSIVSDNATGYLGITDKYIIYNALANNSSEYTTYIMNLDGTNKRAIIEGERLYSVNIKDDYIYYTNMNKQICKSKIDSGKSEILLDTSAYNMNLYGDYIYFFNYKNFDNKNDKVCLYRIKIDSSEKEVNCIKELETYSTSINVIDNWIMYMDGNEEEQFINLVKNDGSREIRLWK